jgi:hypothetical protein
MMGTPIYAVVHFWLRQSLRQRSTKEGRYRSAEGKAVMRLVCEATAELLPITPDCTRQ